jgi:hypothetical protein
MCRAIVQGRQQQERDERQSSWVQPQRMPDFLPVSAQPAVPPIPVSPRSETGFISRLYLDFIISPPKPPPRLNTFRL